MKIAVLADFHLGYARFLDDSFEQAERAFSRACEEADLVVLLGDLFDSRTPKQEILARSFKLFRSARGKKWEAKLVSYDSKDGRKNYAEVPVVAIHGTHERRTKELVNPIELLEKAGFLVNAHIATAVFEKDGERVALQGMGGVPEEYAKSAIEALSPKPVSGAFNIFLFHQSMKEFLPGESLMGMEDLPKEFDLYLCGHIHTKTVQKLDSGAYFIIPGSTVITQMRKEDAESKGFFIFDTRSREAVFHEIQSRPFFYEELEFKQAGLEEVLAKARKSIEKLLEKKSEAKPVIKLKLKGTVAKGLSQSNLDVSSIPMEFENRAIVEVDKDLESETLKEKIDKLRSLRESKLSVRDMGIEVLKSKLKQYGFKSNVDVETLYSMLSEEGKGSADKALKRILEM
ncbi:DNA repair exonuclease [Candidatus Micrarchaeota archaeon]|nr:DNA repair exonuclease [Candidatus Micrarchaeota archaeon]